MPLPGIGAEALAVAVGASDWREVAEDYAPAPMPEELAEEARAKRATLLTESDWTQLPDSPLTSGVREAWAEYRQALRDITDQPGFPQVIDWPDAPAGS